MRQTKSFLDWNSAARAAFDSWMSKAVGYDKPYRMGDIAMQLRNPKRELHAISSSLFKLEEWISLDCSAKKANKYSINLSERFNCLISIRYAYHICIYVCHSLFISIFITRKSTWKKHSECHNYIEHGCINMQRSYE